MAAPPDVVVSPFAKPKRPKIAPGSLAGALLILLVLATGAAVLGGARLWILLPMFGVVALLMLLLAGRLAAGPGIGVGRLVRPDVADAFALAFLVYAGIRYATAPVEFTARIEWMTVLSGAAFFWAARYGLVRSLHGVAILGGLVVIGLGEALFSIWLSLNPGFRPWGESLNLYYWPRFIGSFGCPNHYAAFLYMGTFSALSLGLFLPPKGNRILRLALFAAGVVMSFGVAFSLSRGSWIGFFMGFCAFWVYCVRTGKVAARVGWLSVGGVVALAGIWAAVSPEVQGRITEITSHLSTFGGNQSLDGYVRIVLAHDAWRIIQDYFWFGSGPGTFGFMHPRYQDASYSSLAIFTHDDYLNTWSDYGFVGFALALGFLASVTALVWLRVRKVRREGGGSDLWGRRALLGAGLGSVTALTFHEALDFNFHIPVCAFTGLTLAGLALRANGHGGTGGSEVVYEGRRAKLAARIGAAVLAVVAVLFVVQLTQTAKGYYPFHEVNSDPDGTAFPVAEAKLSEAVRADPKAWEAHGLLADFYRAEAARSADPRERLELGQKAVTSYLAAIELNPVDDGILIRLGMAYDGMGRYDEAYIAYAKAIARRPYNGFYHAYLGAHFWRRGGAANFALAQKEFEAGRNCPYGNDVAFEMEKQFVRYRQEEEARAKAAAAPAPAPEAKPEGEGTAAPAPAQPEAAPQAQP
ncbi:MAG TPA: O-antigen ligase family protein [Candidatus Methylacidiphilales bacterium]